MQLFMRQCLVSLSAHTDGLSSMMSVHTAIEIRVTPKLRHIHAEYPAQNWNSGETLELQLLYVHFLQHIKVQCS